MFSLRAFVYWFCFPLVATVRCGQVNNRRGRILQSPPPPGRDGGSVVTGDGMRRPRGDCAET